MGATAARLACPVHINRWNMGVKVKSVGLEKLQRDKRGARLWDERCLASGEVTPQELQEENSFVPMGERNTIPNFCETIERYYGR